MSNPTKQFVPSVGIYSLNHDDTWCGSFVYRTGNSFRSSWTRNRCWSQLLLLLSCGCGTRMFLEEEEPESAIVRNGGSAKCIENELPKGEESDCCCCWSGGGSRNAWTTVNDVMVVVIAVGKSNIKARSNSTVLLPGFINMARRPSTTRRYKDTEREEMKEEKEAEDEDEGCGSSSRASSWCHKDCSC
jgi:hypothetical protein